jgi:alkanesulfonate monooxygenase SsuD/methylene tetrahydromethanopterin reductase-like flavin-dependent oxidoreductase (luciferase family)
MAETRYWTQLATEQFTPRELVDQAVEAERAGFDGLNVSDHYQPWWEPGESGQACAHERAPREHRLEGGEGLRHHRR